jgi:hypothetical protein
MKPIIRIKFNHRLGVWYRNHRAGIFVALVLGLLALLLLAQAMLSPPQPNLPKPPVPVFPLH